MENRFFRRYGKLILVLFVISFPFVYLGSEAAFKTNSNRVKDWLPDGFEETKDLERFIEHFGGDDLMVVSWDGCTVDDPRAEKSVNDPRAEKLAQRLREQVASEGQGELPVYRKVTTSAEARDQLADALWEAGGKRDGELPTYQSKALSTLEGWIVGKKKSDGSRVGSIVLQFTPEGFDQRHDAVKQIRQFTSDLGIGEDELHIGGPTMDSVAIDEASASALDKLTLVSAGICLVIALFCFRSLLVTIFVLVIAFYTQNLSLALLYATGSTMDSIQLMIPPLVYVLSVSAAVHLVNYYRDSVIEGGIEGAPVGALRHGWVPCFLASATTALGLVSLLVSFLLPIQKFGGYAALGVLCSTGVMFLVLPSLLTVFPPRRWSTHLQDKPKHRSIHIPWQPVTQFVARRRYSLAIVACIVLAVSIVGVANIGATARVHNMFSAEAKILKDYHWLEGNVGPLVPVEVVIRLPRAPSELAMPSGGSPKDAVDSKASLYPMLDRIAIVRHLQEVIQGVDGVESVMSLGKFAPNTPNERLTARKAAVNRVLTARRTGFIDAALLQTEGDFDLWRISARVYARDRHNYAELMARIQEAVEPELEKAKRAYNFAEASAVYTGGVPIVMKAQNQLLEDLKNSFETAFLCIAVAMIGLIFAMDFRDLWKDLTGIHLLRSLVRSVLGGLVCMIPNVLPAVVIFGTMGLAGIKVEVGSMMTATAAMGIAVDDTLHYLTWFRRGLAEGKSRQEAVLFAYERCGTAMIQTTLICGLGLVVFALSPFGPIMRFALMMFSMLMAAIVGDLIVLPALLLSPLGRLFQPREKTTSVNRDVARVSST